MKRPLRLARALVVAAAIVTALSVGSGTANAITWDFLTLPIPEGTSASVGSNTLTLLSSGISLTATGWELDSASDTSYTAANLWKRNEGTNDEGLGVCSPADGTGCADGAVNELDNRGKLEVIRLNLTDLTPLILASAKLSSVDGTNDKYKIFGSDVASPDLTSGSAVLLSSGTSAGGTNPTVLLSGTYTYLFITTDPLTIVNTDGSNFLVRNLSAAPVPEPGTLLLLGSGLAGLGFLGRRRKRKGSRLTAAANR